MIRTFLATTQLTALSTDFSLESVGQRVDEIEDIGITADGFDFLLSDLIVWLDSAEKDVEADSASI